MPYSRRDFLKAAALGATGILVSNEVFAAVGSAPPITITVYKSATCGCCKEWVAHISKNGFAPKVHDLAESALSETKDSLGVPVDLRSCHTAVIGKHVIEGHVPADLIKKVIADKSSTLAGLAVPGMPAGSPGMEVGGRKDPYDVIGFTRQGKKSVYARR